MILGSMDSINESSISELVANKVPESNSLEFKAKLPGNSDSEKKEFLKDVCAMANGDGGDIVYGIEEIDGVSGTVSPILGEGSDEAVRRLGQLLDSCVERRLHGLQFRVVDLAAGGFVLIVRVPQSQIGPHRTVYQGQHRFPIRSGARVVDMSFEQIRMAFDRTATLSEKARGFRAHRIDEIKRAKNPKIAHGYITAIVHSMPLNGMSGQAGADILQANARFAEVGLGTWRTMSRNLNLDGLLVYAPHPDNKLYEYLQLYRSGAVEVFGAPFNMEHEGRNLIPSQSLAEFFRHAIAKALALPAKFGVNGGAYVGLTLLGVTGYELGVSGHLNFIRRLEADRPDLVLPEQWVEDVTNFQIDEVVRPLLDMLWQCFGLERCFYYSPDGVWAPNV